MSIPSTHLFYIAESWNALTVDLKYIRVRHIVAVFGNEISAYQQSDYNGSEKIALGMEAQIPNKHRSKLI
jgi:hypothetical protein